MANNRRRLTGRVISDKMDKTVVVAVDTSKQHRLYGKVVRTTKKYFAHDESNAIPVGSTVKIVESRPLSKKKRWMVQEVINQVSQAEAEAAASEAAAPEAQVVAAELLEEEAVEAETIVEETDAVVAEETADAEAESEE